MPNKFRFIQLLSISAVFLSSSSIAGEESLLSENDFLGDVPMVLSVSRLRQAVSDAPAAVTVIDRQMIRDAGAWDITDLFRLVPGMYVAGSADRGSLLPNPTVSYHGMADSFSRRMQVLVDGRSVYTPLFGGPIWSSLGISMDDIERIEVIRGPSSAAYGANSFLGVINIITSHAAESRGNQLSVMAGQPGGDVRYRYGGKTGDLDYRVTVGQFLAQGITDTPAPTPQNKEVFKRYDNQRVGLLNFRGDYQIDARDSLESQISYSAGFHQTGQQDKAPNYNPPRDNYLESHSLSLRWQRAISPDEQVWVRYFTNRDAMSFDEANAVTTVPGLAVPSPLTGPIQMVAERHDLEAQHTFAPSATTRLVWGGGLRRDAVSSQLFLGTSAPLAFHQSDVFTNLEWRPSRDWVFNGGLMVENNSFTGTHLSPRLAANFHPTPGQTLRLSVSQATHTPVVLEELANYQFTYKPCPIGFLGSSCSLLGYRTGNPLQSERIVSREVGYLFDFGPGNLDVKYSLDDLSRLIETHRFLPGLPFLNAITNTKASDFNNAGDATVRSLEAQLKWNLGAHTRLFAGWAWTRVEEHSPNGFSYSDATPLHTASLLLAHDFDAHWTGSLSHYQMGSVDALSDGDRVPEYRRTDGRLARRFQDGPWRGEVALVVQNLFDHANHEFYYSNLAGRRTFASLRLDF